ncbi:MAG: alpha-glucosidase [Corallococcus sp.]|nr:alpha-glucosidase [Bacillota bacterium]MCM1533815.1 alpha-glucosidase [Corallococcus sp.]
MKNRWYKEAIFYQIYPRSFKDSDCDGIGDIRGIISKIDYLSDLGIDAIWFSPLYASPNADYGYDISDYKAINPEYGTMADFDEMVKLLHAKNIKVVMDLVINHTSDKHEWFMQARSSKDNPYRDYYYFRDGKGKNGKKPPNNWTSFFVGKAWEYDEKTEQWYLHLFDKNQPDLNYSNPKVMKEIQDILRFWLDKGVDGFRCDVITLLSKATGLPNGKPSIALTGSEHYIDGPKMKEYLKQLQEVLTQYDAFTVGESVFINVDKTLLYATEGDEYLTTVFSFDHTSADNHFGVKQLPKKFSLKQLKNALTTWQQGLYGKSWNTLFWENHDCARIVGRYVSATKCREQGAKMLGTVLLTLSGTPFIYQGQEFGTTSIGMKNIDDYKDVDAIRSYDLLRKVFGKRKAMKMIAYCSRDNARTPVQWTSGKNAGFTDGEETWLPITPNYEQINAETEQNDPDSVLHYYKKLIALRKTDKAFVYGTYEDVAPKNGKILAYLRKSEYGQLLVVNNFSLKSAAFTPPKNIAADGFKLVTSNYADSQETPVKMTLRPYESVVYKLK